MKKPCFVALRGTAGITLLPQRATSGRGFILNALGNHMWLKLPRRRLFAHTLGFWGKGIFFLCSAIVVFAETQAQSHGEPDLAVAPAGTVQLLAGAESFIYRDGAPEPMRLYVFKPAGWSSRDHRTAFVFFFGGGWTHGTPERSAMWGEFAASLGMVGIVPDYRTKERFNTSPLAAVADGRAALHWVQCHAVELGIAPDKIVVGGDSSGGHVALWTSIAKNPPGSIASEAPRDKPAALILFSAVSDTSWQTGYTPFRFGDDATALSPLHQLDKKMPPTLAFHGDADRTVAFRQAVGLSDKLKATGNLCELVVVPGGDHGFLKEMPQWRNRSQEIIREFLIKQGLLAP